MNEKNMERLRFESVWDAIEDTPEEAENMKLRSALMMQIKDRIKSANLSQAQAAKLLGVTQPRVSDLMRGKINLFGLDALINMVVAMGLHIQVQVCERQRDKFPVRFIPAAKYPPSTASTSPLT